MSNRLVCRCGSRDAWASVAHGVALLFLEPTLYWLELGFRLENDRIFGGIGAFVALVALVVVALVSWGFLIFWRENFAWCGFVIWFAFFGFFVG